MWEAHYMLLHWLAKLCLIPFDICSMDSSMIESTLLVTNIVESCKVYLSNTGPAREAAAVCLSSLLTRPDMDGRHLSDFMTWAMALLDRWVYTSGYERASLSTNYFLVLGAMHSLFQIHKLGQRHNLLPFASKLLPYLLALNDEHSQTAVRKLISKLVQRIGMNYLPPRVASWRYLRGQRSLNLLSCNRDVVAPVKKDCADGLEDQDDRQDDVVTSDLEDALDSLLCSMKDKDTVVRWSAAKGLGRITMRLSRNHAADVVDAVLEAFEEDGADSSWHGGCLTLAELARRGLLLPERLADVMPILERAIRFDVMRGQHSIGAHVRDSACYVCWAFSRAYSPTVMAPFLNELTAALLTTALFDREVNCRRAASAAYQETVGRQGNQNVPFGIDILTVADYVSVGNRAVCFSALAAKVVALDERLRASFISHLVGTTLKHWDRDMRDLGAKGLASLVPGNPSTAAVELPCLVTGCTSPALNMRHGSIVAVSEVLFALTTCGFDLLDVQINSILDVVGAVEKGRLYRGRGGELVREAVCQLVGSIARSKVAVTVKQQVLMVETLNEHLRQPHEAVQRAAREALREFLFTHFSSGSVPSERLQKLTITKYLAGLATENNVSITRGYGMALGVLPLRLLELPEGRIDEVLACMAESCSPEHRINGEYDANTCCNCVASLIEIAERLCLSRRVRVEHIAKCFAILQASVQDYNIDNRGDTGSWSRVLALKGMSALVFALVYRMDNITVPVSCSSVETSFGIGKIIYTDVKSESVTVMKVSYPRGSLGAQRNSQDNTIIGRQGHNCGSATDLADMTTCLASSEIVLLLQTHLPLVVCSVLKQLAEKLDSVREVAGGVLLRLIDLLNPEIGSPHAAVLFQDLSFIESVLVKHATSQGLAPSIAAVEQSVNWSHPAHVFPIVCAMLDSSVFCASILSGLVVSVGGLSETTARFSSSSLLAHCRQNQYCGSGKVADLVDTLVEILTTSRKIDRVVVPTVKTFLTLLNDGTLDDLSTNIKVNVSERLYSLLFIEVKGSTNMAKVRLVVELQVRLLSFCRTGRTVHKNGMLTVLPMLTHRFPLIRKCKFNMLPLLKMNHVITLIFL